MVKNLKLSMGRDSNTISGDVYNENVDVIQMVPPEEFIKTQKQESAESDLE